MNILSIDYGLKKIGLAFADTIIAEPIGVLRYESDDEVIERILKVIEKMNVQKVILGISEGESAKNSKMFGEKLKNHNIKFEYCDETLTTTEAQKYSIEANIKRKKRKELEDAYAATLMLQWYLENNV